MAKAKHEEDIIEYTKYERARMLGSRALQIAMGAPFMVKLEDADLLRLKYNPIEIAKIEFEKGLLPITVRKPLPKKKI
jgi:DNA-directed RNA polymerase subunit K